MNIVRENSVMTWAVCVNLSMRRFYDLATLPSDATAEVALCYLRVMMVFWLLEVLSKWSFPASLHILGGCAAKNFSTSSIEGKDKRIISTLRQSLWRLIAWEVMQFSQSWRRYATQKKRWREGFSDGSLVTDRVCLNLLQFALENVLEYCVRIRKLDMCSRQSRVRN